MNPAPLPPAIELVGISKSLRIVFQYLLLLFLGIFLEAIGDISINSLEFDLLILIFQLGNEGLIDIVGKNQGIYACFLEHMNIRALLL